MAIRAPASQAVDPPPPSLHLHGTDFERVCVRRSGVAVYRGEIGYLRIGAALEPELAVHRLMLEHGYPVPRILHVGRHHGALFVIEESLGAETLGDRFASEQRTQGSITDEGFRVYLAVAERYALAEAGCAREAHSRGAVATTLVHADLHAFNMCAGGVIDLEGAGWGPAGYDVATAPFVPALCGLTSPRTPWVTGDRLGHYLAMVDRVFGDHGMPKPSSQLDELLVRRAISVCRKGHPDPALRVARRRVLRSVVETFVSGGRVSELLGSGG